MEEVAAAADVSLRAFLRCYPQKEFVQVRDQQRRTAQLRAALDGLPEDLPVLDAVRAALLVMAAAHQ